MVANGGGGVEEADLHIRGKSPHSFLSLHLNKNLFFVTACCIDVAQTRYSANRIIGYERYY